MLSPPKKRSWNKASFRGSVAPSPHVLLSATPKQSTSPNSSSPKEFQNQAPSTGPNSSHKKHSHASGPKVAADAPAVLPPVSSQHSKMSYTPLTSPVSYPRKGSWRHPPSSASIAPSVHVSPRESPSPSASSSKGSWKHGKPPRVSSSSFTPLPGDNHAKGPIAAPPRGLPSRAQNRPAMSPAVVTGEQTKRHKQHSGCSSSPESHTPISLPGKSRPPAMPPMIVSAPPQEKPLPGLESPKISPPKSPKVEQRIPTAAPWLAFPPPPPSKECSSVTCALPLTSSPPGAPCGCVLPIQVELQLGVPLYSFFPLVSDLAAQIAAGTNLKQSQVTIMGANADSDDQDKTIVLLSLVPVGHQFDNSTAFLIFDRFWRKKVNINKTQFGDYYVIYISYPGLPPSPPSAVTNSNGDDPTSNSSDPRKVRPFGVYVTKHGEKLGSGIIAILALASSVAFILFFTIMWLIFVKRKNRNRTASVVLEPILVPSVTKRSGYGGSILSGSMMSSASMSFASSMATYTGSAKTFTLSELEKATDKFNPQNILGEGGFGRVYRGVLADGTRVAVKVLTREDQQGGREFVAEVEMLSRLHHRNLVKLIGICTEEQKRCLVYELIPNGSVEAHLHGHDKETSALDWDARIKIALGAARGLAYLHEDSSPRVIHRDFKASNILLEDDFTPKVSDFGLARSASEEVNGHISTKVMGTFGYVAPEYAMTGHLLVKSDVYSYGVVLLELLSGRKPVDMSQPPGQENLVTWARPLLTSKEGLETLIDPALGRDLPFDSIAKVAAIASMCVQPEVSHRPFMGEVVQALKLVYNDSDASNGGGSESVSQRGESFDAGTKESSTQQWSYRNPYVTNNGSSVAIDYDSGPLRAQGLDIERPLSASFLVSTSESLTQELSNSFRRYSNSGPLRSSRNRQNWYGMRGLMRSSISEHGPKRKSDLGLY
eukprot:TRINITY_DN4451_c0_g2_i4.p1 TRINITY_DN4451_c0_g2~~TRINITY_DN4451_c0_g2_i4.p1  ORF type:complete len:941 (+),score=210.77 TRINITY_DN4451_c0_g2_i4:231-3053(+)